MDPRRIVHDSIKHRIPIDFDQFCDSMRDWEFKTYEKDGEPVVVVMRKANEFHLTAIKHGKWASRKLAKALFDDVLKEYGCAWTRVMNDHAIGHEFVKRAGFFETYKGSEMTTYVMTRNKYA